MFQSVFISAELSTLSIEQNKRRTESLNRVMQGLKLAGLTVDEVQGVYKGTSEKSFRVTTSNDELFNVSFIRGLARRLEQESILWVKDDGKSFLDFIQSGDMVHIGTMREVESVQGLEAYSVIGTKCYAVVK